MMEVGKIFKDIFGMNMRDVSKEMGHSPEYVCQTFKARNGNGSAERVAEKLREIADKNYRADIATAKYKRDMAEKIIGKLV